MKIRLLISTPPGQAEGTEKNLRAFLLTFHKPTATGVSPDKASFYWELDATPKQYANIMRKVTMFQTLSNWAVDNRMVKAGFKKFGATEEQFKEVRHMLNDGTRVEVIKNATAEELVEANKTYWQRLKEKFTSKD